MPLEILRARHDAPPLALALLGLERDLLAIGGLELHALDLELTPGALAGRVALGVSLSLET